MKEKRFPISGDISGEEQDLISFAFVSNADEVSQIGEKKVKVLVDGPREKITHFFLNFPEYKALSSKQVRLFKTKTNLLKKTNSDLGFLSKQFDTSSEKMGLLLQTTNELIDEIGESTFDFLLRQNNEFFAIGWMLPKEVAEALSEFYILCVKVYMSFYSTISGESIGAIDETRAIFEGIELSEKQTEALQKYFSQLEKQDMVSFEAFLKQVLEVFDSAKPYIKHSVFDEFLKEMLELEKQKYSTDLYLPISTKE